MSIVVFHDKIWSGHWLGICDACEPNGGMVLPFGQSEAEARTWAEQHKQAHPPECRSCHATAGHPHTEYCQLQGDRCCDAIRCPGCTGCPLGACPNPEAHAENCTTRVRKDAFDEAIARVSACPDDFPVAVGVIKALLEEVRDGT